MVRRSSRSIAGGSICARTAPSTPRGSSRSARSPRSRGRTPTVRCYPRPRRNLPSRRNSTSAASAEYPRRGRGAAATPPPPSAERYLDNDINLKLPTLDNLFATFDVMRSKGKVVGILKDPGVPPGHETPDVPSSFGERNGGVVFWGPGSRAVAEEWEVRTARELFSSGPRRGRIGCCFVGGDGAATSPRRRRCEPTPRKTATTSSRCAASSGGIEKGSTTYLPRRSAAAARAGRAATRVYLCCGTTTARNARSTSRRRRRRAATTRRRPF